MTHSEIMRIYRDVFPHTTFGRAYSWCQNGFNSVRVSYANGNEVVFTYNEHGTWILESMYNYKNKNNGGNENEI